MTLSFRSLVLPLAVLSATALPVIGTVKADTETHRSYVIAAGRYNCMGETGITSLDGLPRHSFRSCVLVERGSVIIPSLGDTFGCMVLLPYAADGAPVALESRWRFPAPGVPDPRTGERSLELSWRQQWQDGQGLLEGFRFDVADEMVEGVWTAEVLVNDKVIASCCFNVTRDPSAVSSSPIAACSTPVS